jgi:hypothetical protein
MRLRHCTQPTPLLSSLFQPPLLHRVQAPVVLPGGAEVECDGGVARPGRRAVEAPVVLCRCSTPIFFGVVLFSIGAPPSSSGTTLS